MVHRRVAFFAMLAILAAPGLRAADATGKWTAEWDTQIGMQKYTFEFKAEGARLTGKAISDRFGESAIHNGQVNGDEISFVEMLKFEGMELRIEYKGKVGADEMKLTRKVGDFVTEELVAKRAK